MLKSTVIGACLAVALAAGSSACATHPAGEKAVAANDPQCIKDTGTRIQDPAHKCLNQPGSSYTQRDIQNTGEIDTGSALKRLDPRVQ
jgi:hypothetical protein